MLKKRSSALLALLLAGSMLLSSCGPAPAETEPKEEDGQKAEDQAEKPAEDKEDKKEAAQDSEKEIKNLVIPKVATRELETFNILYSGTFSDFENLTNMIDSLVEVDQKGQVVPAIAESWEGNADSTTWTFHIRDGVKWVDMNGNVKGDCTAHDWATGLEWVMNFHKNEASHTSQPIEMIKGAKEYYEYTKALSKEEAYALDASEGSKFFELVGIEVPDDHTLIYHCPAPKPYFPSFPAWAGLYPMPQGMVDELGVDGVKGMNNTNYWYNGCYTMTTFVPGNEKVFTKNPEYWDKDCTRFDTVTIKMVESNDVAFQLYQSGELDFVPLTESNLKTISDNKNHEYYDYLVELPATNFAYQFHLNFDKNNEDGTPDTDWNKAVANEAFRRSWYYGLDLKNYYKRYNAINPMSCENNAYCMKGLLYNSKGVDYADMVREELGLPEPDGENMTRYDAEKAKEYKAQAMEELSALGVKFPIEADYYVATANQTALDSANVLKQTFAECLGDDYVKLNIKTFVSSYSKEVRTPRLQSFQLNAWGADFGDPINFLGQEILGSDGAHYTKNYSNIRNVEESEATKDLLASYEEFTKLVNEANGIIDDMDKRLEAFAKAEAYMIDHVLVLPCYYDVSWCLTKYDPYSQMKAIFGCQNDKMKNWKTNSDGYTTEEAQASKDALKAK